MKNDGTQCTGCEHLDRPRADWWCAHFEDEPTIHCELYRGSAVTSVVSFLDPSQRGPDAVDLLNIGVNVYSSIPSSSPEVFKSGGGGDFGGGGATGSWDLPTTPEPSAAVLDSIPSTFDAILVAASEAGSAGLDAVVSAGSSVAEAACSVADVAGDVASCVADVASSVFD